MTDKTIVYADDTELIRNLCAAYHRKYFPEYEIFMCDDGASLRRRLEKPEGIALVVTDNEMPGENGSKIIRELARELPHIKFILAYGGDKSIGNQAVADGAHAFLLKPFSREGLVSVITNALEARKAVATATSS
ncbi:MAG: response regulator [Candidatus Nanoarchaeia archaeon]|nr:response regulator [Candidatus Nanoarchaeia archaeon]